MDDFEPISKPEAEAIKRLLDDMPVETYTMRAEWLRLQFNALVAAGFERNEALVLVAWEQFGVKFRG
jgi:hypothetical protein